MHAFGKSTNDISQLDILVVRWISGDILQEATTELNATGTLAKN